ncbi:MAG: winged helix-turn-helix domain-containing protein [Gammaproteobacteria bacterium]
MLPLTSRALDTLLFFAQHPGQLLDKDTLMKAVWPNVIVEENNLNQSISAVRRVLGDSRDEHRFIVTVPGQGYRFVCDVKVVTDAPSTLSPPAASPRTMLRVVGSLAGLIVVATLVWVAARRIEHPAAPVAAARSVVSAKPAGVVGTPRLAILPFANLSPEPANAFFADGLHEEILSTLSERLPGVAVISRTTMMTFRQTPKALGDVAKELGATHVMEGTVRREHDQVRLTLQLVDAGTDRYIWSRTYDRGLASSMTLDSEVASEVAKQLSVRLAASSTHFAPVTRDAEAYDLYLRALLGLRDLGVVVWTREAFAKVDDLLNEALARDPEFTLAYAQRARLHTLRHVSSMDLSDAAQRSILADLDAARRRAPGDPIVLAAIGYYRFSVGDFSGCVELIQAAEAAGLREVEWLIPKSRCLLALQRVDEAVAVHERMLSLDPANPLVLAFTLFHLQVAQRPEAALRVANLAFARYPQLAHWLYVDLTMRGDVAAFRKRVDPGQPPLASLPVAENPEAMVPYFSILRFEKRYAELLTLLQRTPSTSFPFSTGDLEMFHSVGQRPVAEFRGWAYLLAGKRAGARPDGRAVLDFVAHQRVTQWNPFYLSLLSAEAYTFLGQEQEALSAARKALELMPRARNAASWLGVAALSARVAAWNGAGDEATTLLEELADAAPGLPPGMIVRDPLLTVPLANNVRYQALTRRLEERMSKVAPR